MKLLKCVALVAAVALLVFSVSASTHAASLKTKDRGVDPNQARDTLVTASLAAAGEEYRWDISLPAATYYVTLCSGDARYSVGPVRAKLSGDDGSSWTTVVDDIDLVPMEFYPVLDEEITVTDLGGGTGYLSLELGGTYDVGQGTGLSSPVNFIIVSETAGGSFTSPFQVNFQPAGASLYPPYLVCANTTEYADQGSYTYGWTDTTTLKAKNRGVEAEPVDSTNAITSVQRTFELEVPIGTYYYEMAVGDAMYEMAGQQVSVEDINVIEDVTTSGSEHLYIVNRITNVFDGKFTMVIGSGTVDESTAINYLRVFNTRPPVQYPVRINFQPGYVLDLAPGFAPDTGAVEKDLYGYGWTRPRGDYAIEAGINADFKYDTFVYVDGSEEDVEWNYELAETVAQNYYIYMSIGDPRYAAPNQYVIIDGTTIADDVDTTANNFYEVRNMTVALSDRVTDSNSTNDCSMVIGHDIEDSWTVPNYIIIHDEYVEDWTFPIEIDFHNSSRSVCAGGYLSDTGNYFDLVRRYGWDYEGMKSDINQINTPDAPDVCLKESMVYPEIGGTAEWRIEELPAGDYDVEMLFGDADYGSFGAYGVIIQGIDVGFGALAANEFNTVNQTVTVTSSGVLTLDLGNATPGVANCICKIVIDQSP